MGVFHKNLNRSYESLNAARDALHSYEESVDYSKSGQISEKQFIGKMKNYIYNTEKKLLNIDNKFRKIEKNNEKVEREGEIKRELKEKSLNLKNPFKSQVEQAQSKRIYSELESMSSKLKEEAEKKKCFT